MAQAKVIFNIDPAFPAEARAAIGGEIVGEIVNRTLQGIDRFGTPFKGYSKSYKDSKVFDNFGKSNLVNLRLTSDMLSSLQVLSHGPGFIVVGYEEGTEANEKALWAIRGENGPKRDFLGLPTRAVNKIVAKFQSLKPDPILSAFQRGLIIGALEEEDDI